MFRNTYVRVFVSTLCWRYVRCMHVCTAELIHGSCTGDLYLPACRQRSSWTAVTGCSSSWSRYWLELGRPWFCCARCSPHRRQSGRLWRLCRLTGWALRSCSSGILPSPSYSRLAFSFSNLKAKSSYARLAPASSYLMTSRYFRIDETSGKW